MPAGAKRHIARRLSLPVVAVLSAWLMGGLVLAVGEFTPYDIEVNPSIELPWPWEGIVGVMLAAGAALAVASTAHWRKESTAWRLELLAHPILVATWMMYGLLVFLSGPSALFPQSLAGGFAAASVMRMIEVVRHVEWTRTNVENYQRMMGDHDVA